MAVSLHVFDNFHTVSSVWTAARERIGRAVDDAIIAGEVGARQPSAAGRAILGDTVDVAILGGGIVGCAAAYYLSREGIDTAVIDHQGIGAAASGYALGLLNPLVGVGIPGTLAPFAAAAFAEHLRLWPLLQAESSIEFHGRTLPHLELALNDADAAAVRQEARRWDAEDGFAAQWLAPREVRELDARISEDIAGAALLEDVGMVDSRLLTMALMDAASRSGARVVLDRARGITGSNGRATGVKTARGEIGCGAVVAAMGPWSGSVGAWLGLDIPVNPFKGQIVRLEGLHPPIEYHVAGSAAVAQKSDGLLWVASTEEDAGFDLSTTCEARGLLLDRARRFLPPIGGLRAVDQTACLRPRTADGLPILGRVQGWDNVYAATGAGKKGILLGPAMGLSAADLAVERIPSAPIDGFGFERFRAGE